MSSPVYVAPQETTLDHAWAEDMARVERGGGGAPKRSGGSQGGGGGNKSYGAAPSGSGAMGDPLWMDLLKMGANPSFINQLLRQQGKGLMGQSLYGAFFKDSGHSGMQQARQAAAPVQSRQRPGGGMMGPAPAKAGPRTQGQQDYDAERERRRRMADMDAEMAHRVKWMNAMGLGGPGGQVSETEVTGQLYNNAGEHKVMPITTKRSRDITPQERAQYYQMIMGGR